MMGLLIKGLTQQLLSVVRDVAKGSTPFHPLLPEQGGQLTERPLVVYKCNKVSLKYLAPPLKLSDL